MNVVHLQLSGGIGGISILTRDIANISKHNNIFYFLFEGGVVAQEIHSLGHKVQIENDKDSSFKKSAKKFLDFCIKNKADVIICHTGSPICRYVYSYTKKHYGNAEYLLYLHSNASDSIYPNKVKQIINRYLIMQAYKASDKVVAISESVKNSFEKIYSFDKNKITVVYNGIDCSKFYSNRLNCPDDEVHLVYVGRVFEQKGIHILIDAINMCKYKEKIKLSIVGRDHGDYTERMKKKVSELGLNDIITFEGSQNDVTKYLAEADIFIHPAIWEEGFGITLIEAMASYVPCIAFRKGAIPEVIDSDVNGLIADNPSAEELKDAIEKMVELRNEKTFDEFRSNARKKAEYFSIENTVKTLEELY